MGLFFGTASAVSRLVFDDSNKVEVMEKYNPPSANMWKAVAEALSKGIEYVPILRPRRASDWRCSRHFVLRSDAYAPKKFKPYMPSAMGLGLSWVMGFSNSFSFFVGAVIAFIWSKINKRTADLFVIPVASGAVAGESLICALIGDVTSGKAIGH